MNNKYTVGRYLVRRLEDAGLKHIFGVPGDYVLKFFDCLEDSTIKVVTTCNELNAGYAADAYARVKGFGAVCVTYGVGGFSLFNAAVGAFAERVPLVIISGAPKASERAHRHLLHHTIGDMNLQFNIYEKIAESSAILDNPDEAPAKIDLALASCLRLKRPVYIEVPFDIVSQPCSAPGPFPADKAISSDKEILDEAAAEAVSILKSAKKAVILAGIEAHRLGLRHELEDLISHTGYPFASTLLGKAVIPEKHPQFIGVYCGALLAESTRRIVENADVVLCLGTLMTDINLGAGTAVIDPSRKIVANSDKVRIKHHVYPSISLKDFISALRSGLPEQTFDKTGIEHPSAGLKGDFIPAPDNKMTLKRFYRRVNRFITKDNVIVSDTGDAIFCSAGLYLPQGVEYIGQAFYLSIGYAVPAALGVKCALPDKRPVVFVGDGAFQMTAQELSTIIKEKQNPVIFLINNDGYTIERVMNDGPYNDIRMWKYSRLPEVFGGGWGCEVKTEGQLEEAIARTSAKPSLPALIEVCIDKWDCSEALKGLGRAFNK